LFRSFLYNALAISIILIGWHFLYIVVQEPLIFPDSTSILSALYDLLWTSKFWFSFYYTMRTLVLSYIIGMFITIGIILLCMKYQWLKALFERYCAYFNPLPSFVLVPFMSLFMGLGAAVVYSIIVWNIVWTSGLQILRAIESVHEQWEKHVRNLQWSGSKALLKVYMPAAIGNLIGIASTSWANSWRILISLEVVFGSIGGYFGLGSYIIDVKSKLDIDQMYAILFVIALTGVTINSLLNSLKKKYSY